MAIAAARVKVPSLGGIGSSIQSYGVGRAAGLGFRLLSGITGSGLIGGAISAAVVGAAVPGPIGQMVAVNLGFAQGQQGLPAFGNLFSGIGNFGFGGGSNRSGAPFLLV